MKTIGCVLISFIMAFSSCKHEDPIVTETDQGIADLKASLNGDWISSETRLYSNSDGTVYASYYIAFINCNLTYDFRFDLVQQMSISNLAVTYTYLCTPSRRVTLTLKRDSMNKIYAEEYDGTTFRFRYDIVVSGDTMIMTANPPFGEKLFKPELGFAYVVYLKRK